MADLENPDGPARPVQIRDFIFVRELSEVYLLLDFISGRWDKGLEPDVQLLIEEICEIGWPPEDGPKTQAHQAAILLKAKDKLNAAAKPANGATIAFTLLVVGEDDPRQRKFWGRHTDRRGTGARSGERTDQRARGRQENGASGAGGADRRAANGGQEYPLPPPGLGGPSGPGGLRGRMPRPVASAHHHHAAVAPKEPTITHQDQVATGPISRYLSNSSSSETPKRYIASSPKRCDLRSLTEDKFWSTHVTTIALKEL
eukprot:gene31143-38486_t